MKTIEEEIKKFKFSKSTSDKNKDKINVNNLPVNGVVYSSHNKKVTFMRRNSISEEGKSDVPKRVNRAQSTSVKFFHLNSAFKKSDYSENNQRFLRNNISSVNKSVKKK